MKSNRLILWAITAALSGFLFGFDTVVISGAEQRIQELWGLQAVLHGLAISSALWGTLIGALVGGWPTERLGRKKTLFGVGILYFVSAIGSALAPEVYSFMAVRFIGGLAVGVSTVAAPLYIAEISPAKYRGRLAGMFQFNVVFGILIAFVSNASLAGMGENAWRWMLGVEALPALVFTILCFRLPESPRWLISHAGQREEGIRVFELTEPATSRKELEQRADKIAAAAQIAHTEKFFTRRLRFPIMLAVLIAFFNQFSGINAVLYFAPRIFEMAGMGQSSALLQSIGLGMINLIFTILGLWMIDRFGRRMLLYIGSIGYVASLGLCSWAFYSETHGLVAACIFAFIAAHAIGQGMVVWVFISEIFPNRNRASGQAVGSFTIWICAAAITFVFPMMAEHVAPGTIFAFFCFMMVLQLLWVHFLVPETKNVPLEEMQRRLGIAEAS